MKILITGVAGFIGFHLSKSLINQNLSIIGIDNINNYYDKKLKINRLEELGIKLNKSEEIKSKIFPNFIFLKLDINSNSSINKLFSKYKFDIVVHLAAQAGVRYSLKNPKSYIKTNLNGFHNIIDYSNKINVKLFIYASSSSVYGGNKHLPFAENQNTDKPLNLYAATKKSNELIAYSYSHLFRLKTIGLRFFTVYGPWGRPDMAYFKFSDLIFKNKEIEIYNEGLNFRDFTYVDDIINGINNVIFGNIPNENYLIYNLGNNKSISIKKFISILEKNLNKKAKKKYIEQQDGDVEKTWANIELIKNDYKYEPQTDIEIGLKNFCEWYLNYKKDN